MLSKEEKSKIMKLKQIEKEFEELYKQVQTILQNRYPNVIEFDNGDSIGNIITKEKIPKIAQKSEDGAYMTYTPFGEDWGKGTVYVPINRKQYLEIYYTT